MTKEEARTALGDRNNLLWGMSKEEKEYYSKALDMAISALSEEDNTMEWIKINARYKAPDSMFQCSECGELNYVNDNYCPGCGRKYKPTRT